MQQSLFIFRAQFVSDTYVTSEELKGYCIDTTPKPAAGGDEDTTAELVGKAQTLQSLCSPQKKRVHIKACGIYSLPHQTEICVKLK